MACPPKVEEKYRRGHQSQGSSRAWSWRLYIPQRSSPVLHTWLIEVDHGKPLLCVWPGSPWIFYSCLPPIRNGACATAEARTWEPHLYIKRSLEKFVFGLSEISKWSTTLFERLLRLKTERNEREKLMLCTNCIFEVLWSFWLINGLPSTN